MGSVASTWWNENTVSVGASGGIFGLYGLFFSLLTTSFFRKETRRALLTGIASFIVLNLMYGLKQGVDGAAHIGGLLAGFLIGYIIYAGTQYPKWKRHIALAILLLPLMASAVFLKYYKDDNLVFNRILIQIIEAESYGMRPYEIMDEKSDQQFAGELERDGIPNWTKATSYIEESYRLKLNAKNQKLRDLLKEYVYLRLKESTLYLQKIDDPLRFSENELSRVQQSLSEIEQKITALK